MKILTRKEAIAKGLKRYFTGKPCPHGHICERYLLSTNCIECVKIINKKMRERPGAKLQKRKRKWWLTAEYRAYRMAWYHKNREKINAKKKAANRLNPEKQRALNRRKYLKNPQYFKDRARLWEKKNRKKYNECQRRYARLGPINPKGERQWLRKNEAQLRAVRRFLRGMNKNPTQAVSQLSTEASALGLTLPSSWPQSPVTLPLA